MLFCVLALINEHTCENNILTHTMDMLWEKFQWIRTLYMKPISFQSKASLVCSVTTAVFIDFCLKKLNVFSQHIGQKINEYQISPEKIHRNWNVDQVSLFITSWDIILWCSINLLWKELLERMSEHKGLISSYQLLVTAACTNTGGKMKGSRHRAADPYPFVHRHSLSQVTSFMAFPVVWPTSYVSMARFSCRFQSARCNRCIYHHRKKQRS